MKCLFFNILLILMPLSHCEYAYVSTLSSDNFVLAARVLAHRLNLLNNYPYLIIATEEVSNSSIVSLRSMGVTVQVRRKIDTPYLETHRANKYQYTKIHLWSLTNYSRLVHLDLDILPRVSLAQLFHCGTFCASFRHSDKFNSGVFVLEPNLTVYEDMLQKAPLLDSYDGGDQGFLNSYFSDLKYSPMFNDANGTIVASNSTMRTLSAAYNYDIAMYYLNDRMLVHPKIIHYTLGPTKPWLWWTYPLFDLNWEWMRARYDMEEAYGVPRTDVNLILTQTTSASLLYALYLLTRKRFLGCCYSEEVTFSEANAISIIAILMSLIVSFECVPPMAHPNIAWLYFFGNTIMWLIFLCSLYTCVRFSRSPVMKDVLRFILACLLMFCSNWMLLLAASSFHRRVFLLFISLPLTLITLCLVQHRFLIGYKTVDNVKYALVEYSNTGSPAHLH